MVPASRKIGRAVIAILVLQKNIDKSKRPRNVCSGGINESFFGVFISLGASCSSVSPLPVLNPQKGQEAEFGGSSL